MSASFLLLPCKYCLCESDDWALYEWTLDLISEWMNECMGRWMNEWVSDWRKCNVFYTFYNLLLSCLCFLIVGPNIHTGPVLCHPAHSLLLCVYEQMWHLLNYVNSTQYLISFFSLPFLLTCTSWTIDFYFLIYYFEGSLSIHYN